MRTPDQNQQEFAGCVGVLAVALGLVGLGVLLVSWALWAILP